MRIEIDGVIADYLAVPVEGAEFDRVVAEDFRIGVVPNLLVRGELTAQGLQTPSSIPSSSLSAA